MAHFARLNSQNIVEEVLVVSNEDVNNLSFPESEPVGSAFLNNLFNSDYVWKQTSYNNNFRVRYAGIGFSYSPEYDAFIGFQPFPSWILNTTTLEWESPVPYPSDDINAYYWDEETVSWKLVITS